MFETGVFTNASTPPNNIPVLNNHPVTTEVAAQVASIQLLPVNDRRRNFVGSPSAVVANASTSIMYLLLGDGAAGPDNFTYEVQPNGNQEITDYNGRVAAAWVAANGHALVTEMV